MNKPPPDGSILIRDSRAIAALQTQLYSLLQDDRHVRKFLAEAFFVIKANEKLMHSTMHSLLCSIFEAASVGLSLSRAVGQAYLVPFKNTKKAGQPLEATLIVGYRGYETLAWRESKIITFANCVFRKDTWAYEQGTHPRIYHVPYEPEEGQPNRMISAEFRGAYAVFTHPDGRVVPVYMDRQEIEKRKARSRNTAEGTFWNHADDFYMMAQKTPIRYGASKFIAYDIAPKLVELATRDDLRSLGQPVDPAVLPDSGKTADEAASEITGQEPDPSMGSPGEQGAGAPVETAAASGSEENGFKQVQGVLISAVARGKSKWITVRTEQGDFELSTFDSEQLRRAQELVNSRVEITYTDAVKGDKTYHNVVRGAAIEAL